MSTLQVDTINEHTAAAGVTVDGLLIKDGAIAGLAEALPLDAAINAQSDAYELVAGDAGKIIECDGTFTVTLPDGLDAGFQCSIVNVGTGTITLAAATTLQSAGAAVTLATQYKGCVVYHRGSNVWLAMGGLE